ncbi:hypothetical protein RHSIM_Rhsim04G0160200 [Rhododendron simsii]|uniref:Uncharacterized protein n=1 Tax=Rhododendron simsii TaxID=118357 RepID=A0A834H3R5_RHOSS|nr:hypothetical protein RHSIM_Rhsim04G0160200 [Rhododendron simsii]
MHRSSSGSRVSDEYSDHPPSNQSFRSESATTAADQLPKYNPQSYVANKERSRLKSAETAVHLIPLLLVLCGIILWFFSTPGENPFID